MIVYLILNTLTGRHYVGKTTRTLQERWLEHCRDARNNRKNGDLYEDLRRMGPSAFTITELGVAYSQRRLNQMERKFIRLHGEFPAGLYNKDVAAHGGKPKTRSTKTYTLSAEHKRRIADGRRLAWQNRRALEVVA